MRYAVQYRLRTKCPTTVSELPLLITPFVDVDVSAAAQQHHDVTLLSRAHIAATERKTLFPEFMVFPCQEAYVGKWELLKVKRVSDF